MIDFTRLSNPGRVPRAQVREEMQAARSRGEAISLTEWALVETSSPFAAPETRTQILVGRVHGRGVQTSNILSTRGRVVTTISGSRYKLVGPPESGYAKFLRENGLKYNPRRPVIVRKV